jgi:PAS domain S-box-containing protein
MAAVVIAAIAIALCLHTANHIARTADENLRKLAQQDTARIAQNLTDWLDLRRQTLRGLAALFAGSSEVAEDEFAHGIEILRQRGDSRIVLPLAYARVSADGTSLAIIYSTETDGLLARGRDLAIDPQAATLIRTAFPAAGHTVTSPVAHDRSGNAYTFMAFPLERPGQARELMLTVVRYQDVFSLISQPAQGIALRSWIRPRGGEPAYINGSAEVSPGTLFTITFGGERNGTYYQQAYDILGNYPGRQASTENLALAVRLGGTLTILIVLGLVLKMLDLYRQSLQRAASLQQTHAKLQESELHYRTLIDQVPGVVFRAVAAPERRKVYFSPAVTALTGYEPDELLGAQNIRDLIVPEDRERVRRALDLEHGTTTDHEIEYRIRDRAGLEHWISERNHVSIDAQGQRIIDGVMIDISAQKTVESSLRSKVNLLRGILDNAPEVMIHGVTLKGEFRFLNPASAQILGWVEDEVRNRSFQTLGIVSELDAAKALALFRAMASTMQPLPAGEWQIRNRDGAERVLLASLFPIHDESGETLIITIGLDITERKRAEVELLAARDQLEQQVQQRTAALERSHQELKQAMSQLVQSEKLASLGSLVAGIAHELNTPLGNSVTVASTLRQKVEEFRQMLDDNQLRRSELEQFLQSCEEATGLIEKSSQRAGRLINNFKQVAVDTTSERRREFELGQVVAELVSTLRPLYKHTAHRIEIDIPPGLYMMSYPGPLEQIITNLVTNSLRHGFSGDSDGVIHISARQQDSHIVLEYRDNGSGIPDALKRRVFDPFFTTKLGQGGSGLGLYIVFNLVQGVLGGALALADAEGGGCRFTLTLPLQAPLYQDTSSDEHPVAQG